MDDKKFNQAVIISVIALVVSVGCLILDVFM